MLQLYLEVISCLFTHLNIFHLQKFHVLAQILNLITQSCCVMLTACSVFSENLMSCEEAKPGQRHQPGKPQQISAAS